MLTGIYPEKHSLLPAPLCLTEESSQNAQEVHARLWPGWSIPQRAISKKASHYMRQPANESIAWFIATCIPTSLFVSYLVWGLSYWRRTSQDRLVAGQAFAKLFSKVLGSLPPQRLRVPRIDENTWSNATVSASLTIPAYFIWPQDSVKLHVLKATWEARIRNQNFPVSSHFDRPGLLDFILFAMDPSNPAARHIPGLVQTAYCLVTQLACILDEQFQAAVASVAQLSFGIRLAAACHVYQKRE